MLLLKGATVFFPDLEILAFKISSYLLICFCEYGGLDLCFSVLLPHIAASLQAQEYCRELRVRQVTQPVCSQSVNLLRNCIPVLKRGVAISVLSVWISVPCGAVPSLRAPLLGIYSLAPDSFPLLTQWALCTYIYCCCGTLLRIFGNYTRSRSSHAYCCCFTEEKCNRMEGKCREIGMREEACRN